MGQNGLSDLDATLINFRYITNDIATFSQFKTGWQKNLPAVVHAAASLDPDTRTFFFRVLGELASISLRNFPELLRDHTPHIT